jgi:hypothetical protein
MPPVFPSREKALQVVPGSASESNNSWHAVRDFPQREETKLHDRTIIKTNKANCIARHHDA